MTKIQILVIGDVMLDRFVMGDVERLSPEAPVPILTWDRERLVAGGAANVARNLAHLGVGTELIGIVGKDENAKNLKDMLSFEANIRFTPIIDSTRPTTIKTRFTSNGQQMLRVDHEVSKDADAKIISRIIALAERKIKKSQAIIISDYNKGVINKNTAQKIIKLASQNKIPVFVDPKKTDPAIFAGADLLTPNLHEFRKMTPMELNDNAAIKTAAHAIAKQNNIKAMLITLGADGMMLTPKTGPSHHINSIAQSVFDVSGAGDTVIATCTAAYTAGASLSEATAIANTAAGIVIGKAGTATTVAGEIIAAIANSAPLSLKEATVLREQWRSDNLRVGFTNGCFDQLHPGHLFLLEKAAKTCDKLIVGLNADTSVRELKGSTRPYQNQAKRAAVLQELPFVDAVIIFDEKTPNKIVKALSPDRLIKGGDYKKDQVIGGKHVCKTGGKVVIVPLKPGFSTTKLASY